MPDSPPPSAPAVSSALSAFLRGIERRAYVFAHVQCGREDDAEAALGRTIHAFQSLSTMSPLSSWPAGFWALLLAQPELSGDGASNVPELATLGSGPRAALLLRLVGGLDFTHAAQVLGVSEATYRYALQRALQQLGDAGVSYAQLRTLRERLHRQIKTLPEERIAALSELRQRVLAGTSKPEPVADAGSQRRPLRVLWGLLALLALAFAATFLGPRPALPPGGTEGLPAEENPTGMPALAPSDVVMHPDYSQLADPEAARIAEDVALLSWLANHPEVLADPPAPADPSAKPADPSAKPAQAPAAPPREDADAR